MHLRGHFLKALGLVLLISTLAAPASAQITDQLSAYTGVNAEGFLNPLAEAFGVNLNDAFYYSADIPRSGLKLSFEIVVMGFLFDDEDRTFQATTEGGFAPQQTVEAPTIVGSGEALTVNGNAMTSFAFPGGLGLNSFGLAAPQLRFGSIMGTEGLVRFFTMEAGDSEVGDLTLFGLGARHSISQYLPSPVSLSVGAMWQSFKVGDDFIDASAFTLGVQASKRFSLLEPFAGFSYDRFAMDVEFESKASGPTEKLAIEFDADNTARLTLGLALHFFIGHGYGSYSISGSNNFSFGVALGK
ncbi:MAG: hypothetical protein OEN01_06075 [Candidatus Krumholzibacteria bacterium]|nr:hypothetical protein [Candidatus Krumholzibacteria bacterium]